MRESRWRSMSIMDLNLTRRRSSALSTPAGVAQPVSAHKSAVPIPAHSGSSGATAQNYELIKSTQVRIIINIFKFISSFCALFFVAFNKLTF